MRSNTERLNSRQCCSTNWTRSRSGTAFLALLQGLDVPEAVLVLNERAEVRVEVLLLAATFANGRRGDVGGEGLARVEQRLQPAGGEQRVVLEQADVVAPDLLQDQVLRRGRKQVVVAAKHPPVVVAVEHLLHLAEVALRGRGVDDQQLEGERGVLVEAREGFARHDEPLAGPETDRDRRAHLVVLLCLVGFAGARSVRAGRADAELVEEAAEHDSAVQVLLGDPPGRGGVPCRIPRDLLDRVDRLVHVGAPRTGPPRSGDGRRFRCLHDHRPAVRQVRRAPVAEPTDVQLLVDVLDDAELPEGPAQVVVVARVGDGGVERRDDAPAALAQAVDGRGRSLDGHLHGNASRAWGGPRSGGTARPSCRRRDRRTPRPRAAASS